MLVPNCLGETTIPSANFDPCVSGRQDGTTLKLTILTTHASHWNMGLTTSSLGGNELVAFNDGPFLTNFETPFLSVAPGVLGNDFGGGEITAELFGTPDGGSVELSSSGAFTFTPAAGHCGPANFQYRVLNGALGSEPATVLLNVNCEPIADPDAVTVLEDSGTTAITVLTNDSDPDGQPFSITAVTQGANGTVAFPAGGAFLSYQPAVNFFGTDSFTYTITDARGDSATTTVNVVVTPVNDAPSFAKGANQTALEDAEQQSVPGWATALSAGPANESGQTFSFTTANNNEALFAMAPSVLPDGTLTYQPAPNAEGSATVTVSIQDNGGTDDGGVNTSATQSFTIAVTAVNDAPSFLKGANQSMFEDTGAQLVTGWATAISTGPANEAGQTVSFEVSSDNPALFSAQPAVSPTGTLTFDPALNANGSATVSVRIQDNGGTANGGVDTSAPQAFTISVSLLNDAPSFTPGANQTVNEDAGPQTVPFWATSLSAGPADETMQTLTFDVAGNTNPALFTTAPAISADGTLTYTAAPNAFGTATVMVTLRDDGGVVNGGVDSSAAHTLVITVTPVNDDPVANTDSATVAEDSGANAIDVLANDTLGPDVGRDADGDGGDPGRARHGRRHRHGCQLHAGRQLLRRDSFTYTISDGNGGSATATVNVTVTPVNDDPVANTDSATVAEDSGVNAIDVLANDTLGPDAGETLTVTAVTQGAHGTVAVTATGVSYTPAANYFGADSFTYTIGDGNGGSATATVTVTVTPVNDDPVANNDSATVAEDSGVNAIDVLANDTLGPDADETLTVTAVTQGAHGTVAVTATGVSYTPTANYYGPDSFTYTIGDGNGGSATATVNVTVTPVNDDPVADTDSATVAEDSGVTAIDVLANDTLGPDVGETLTVTAVTQGAHGSGRLHGHRCQLHPGRQLLRRGQLHLHDRRRQRRQRHRDRQRHGDPVNDDPVAITDSATVAEDSGVNAIEVLANDTLGPDAGETLTVTAVTQGTNGTVAVTPTGVSYAPNANYFGADSFTYTIGDGNGGSATATVNVTVTSVNDNPVANSDSATVAEDSGVTAIAVLANDTLGPDVGETLTVTAVTQGAHGTAAVTATGVSYAPTANYFGADSFTYTISDGNGGSATATVNVTVTPVNDNPVANTDSATVAEDSGVNAINVLANDTLGPDVGETLTVTAVTQGAHGTAAVTATGVSYAPNANYFGADSFTYTISDGNGGSATATVNVTVTPVNDNPVANTDARRSPKTAASLRLTCWRTTRSARMPARR